MFRKKLATQRFFAIFTNLVSTILVLTIPTSTTTDILGTILAWTDATDTDICVICWGNRYD